VCAYVRALNTNSIKYLISEIFFIIIGKYFAFFIGEIPIKDFKWRNFNMKKVLAIVLALAMVFAFAACGETKTNEPKVDHNTDGKKIAYVLTEVGDTYSLGLGSSFATAFKPASGEGIEE